MEADLLDHPLEQPIDKNDAFLSVATTLTLISFVLTIAIINALVCTFTIPDSAQMTTPSFAANMRVTYVLSFVIIIIIPLISFITALLTGLIPFKKYSYSKKIILGFVFISCALELTCLVQLVHDAFHEFGV